MKQRPMGFLCRHGWHRWWYYAAKRDNSRANLSGANLTHPDGSIWARRICVRCNRTQRRLSNQERTESPVKTEWVEDPDEMNNWIRVR